MKPLRYLSLFSGIEAASAAWKPLGWECAGVAEIEPFPCAVLKHHYPNVPNLGDVTKVRRLDIKALGPIDLVVFGSPCQDLSVAGKRAGMKGARSGLFFDAVRIIRWARQCGGARFALWENVPGAYSSNEGRDFAAVVGKLSGLCVDVPEGGWRNTGVAAGFRGLVEWSTLDAQWFGVPQRRRRIFALADFGDWAGRSPILLEPYGLQGNNPPRREAGEATSHDIAPSLTGIGRGVERSGESRGQDPVIAFVTHALRADGFDASEDGTGRGTPLIPIAFAQNTRDEVRLFGGDGQIVGALAAEPGMKQQSYIAFTNNAGDCAEGIMSTLKSNCHEAIPMIAFSCKDHGADAGEVHPTLRGMAYDGSHANGGGQVAVCYGIDEEQNVAENLMGCLKARQEGGGFEGAVAIPILEVSARIGKSTDDIRAGSGIGEAGDPMYTLQGGKQHAVAFRASGQDGFTPSEISPPVTSTEGGGAGVPSILEPLKSESGKTGVRAHAQGMAVRRLTPEECEKLQGFEPRYTAIQYHKILKSGKISRRLYVAADGPRYKALGNSMAVPVMAWIGRRIMAALGRTPD